MSRSKDKGTAAESDVIEYLRGMGFPAVERRALSGTQDRGDVAGIPGVTIEVKNCARVELAAWVDEAGRERLNNRDDLGVVWHKRRGRGSPAHWFVTMDGATLVKLLVLLEGRRPSECAPAQLD